MSSHKIIDNSFNSTELTKINIEPIKVFATKDDELHHIRLEVEEYLASTDYDKCIFIKYTRKKQINANAANTIFVDIMNRFYSMLSLIDLYSIMSTYFEINYVELYKLLSPAIQQKLKQELSTVTSYTIDELNVKKLPGGLYMPAL
jgi:hypothetical protein